MSQLSDLILLAAKHHANSGGEAILGLVFTIIIAVLYIAAGVRKSKNVVWKGGVPCCPNCGRQISLKLARPNCRSCGHNLMSPPAQSTGELSAHQAREDQERWTRFHTMASSTCEGIKPLLLGPLQYRTYGGELQVVRKNLYTIAIRQVIDDDFVGWSVQTGPDFQRVVAAHKPANWPACSPIPPYSELAQVVARIDQTIIVGRKSRARPLGLTCAATQGSYCLTPQDFDQLRHSSRLERDRKRRLELEDARRTQERERRERLEQDETLRRLAEQEDARTRLEAQLKRERRREWHKQHEAVLLGVGLPVAVVGITTLLILVIHLHLARERREEATQEATRKLSERVEIAKRAIAERNWDVGIKDLKKIKSSNYPNGLTDEGTKLLVEADRLLNDAETVVEKIWADRIFESAGEAIRQERWAEAEVNLRQYVGSRQATNRTRAALLLKLLDLLKSDTTAVEFLSSMWEPDFTYFVERGKLPNLDLAGFESLRMKCQDRLRVYIPQARTKREELRKQREEAARK
jgi:hypothetical protein